MNKVFAIVILLASSFCLKANPDSTSTEGINNIDTTTFVYANVMYEKGQYATSIDIYNRLLEQEGPSATLYYNIGNCYYKTGQLGEAVLNYERALFLDPGNDDATYNLSLANARIRDRMEPRTTSIFIIWWHAVSRIMGAQAWGIIAIVAMWLALMGWAAYLLPQFRAYQRIGFFTAIIAFSISILCTIGHFGRKNYDAGQTFAIVMSPSAVIKSEPSETSTNLALLHEGFKLKLIEADSRWSKIEMPDGVIGWMHRKDYAAINPFTGE